MRLDMSDDLVKRLTIRLQEIYDRPHDFSNGQKSEAAGLARDRIEELEAKLAKAVAALKFHNAAVELCIGEVTPAMKEAHKHTKRTLAELTGGKDE